MEKECHRNMEPCTLVFLLAQSIGKMPMRETSVYVTASRYQNYHVCCLICTIGKQIFHTVKIPNKSINL